MILGITGISGVGKHTAAQFFGKKGWMVFDADKVAHNLYRPYTYVWKALVKRFGESILTTDDLIDRQKLRAIVFDAENLTVSESALNDLNDILHPEIRRSLHDHIHRHFRRKSNIVIVAALWKELKLFELCDKILLIRAGESIAFNRLKKREGMDKAMYKHYTAKQAEPPSPHFVVENERGISEFNKGLEKVYQDLSQDLTASASVKV